MSRSAKDVFNDLANRDRWSYESRLNTLFEYIDLRVSHNRDDFETYLKHRFESRVFNPPEMTHELSTHWEQPVPGEILIVDSKAHMARATWEKLAEYDTSFPSGVYEGKMWRASGKDAKGSWQQLRWYDVSKHPDKCSTKHLDVVVCDGIMRLDGRVCRLLKTQATCDSYFDIGWLTDKTPTCLACVAIGATSGKEQRKP
jgi:hypothetical protein